MKRPRLENMIPAEQRFQPGEPVTIDWHLATSNGTFSESGCQQPLSICYFLGPMGLSLKTYLVQDARGVTDVVDERVLSKASAR